MKAGVYSITAPSGRQYIGSSIRFDERWREHRHRLKRGTHDNAPLQAAWNKYGNSLVFKKLIVCKPEQAVMYEQLAIDALNPTMNVCRVAGSTLGYKHTDDTKAKFSERARSFGNQGKKHSDKTKLQISLAKKGKPSDREYGPPSVEVREKIRSTLKANYKKENHPNYGKKLSPELCRKFSETRRGKNNNGSSIPVLCIETGREFPSSSEAARWLVSIGKTARKNPGPYIAAAARGKYSSAYGYSWAIAAPSKI